MIGIRRAIRQQSSLSSSVLSANIANKQVKMLGPSKSTVTPHIQKVEKLVVPYYQKVKKFSEPYIDQVIFTATRPQVDKARVVLTPYTQEVVHVYGNFLESATKYHEEVYILIIIKC